MTVSRAAPLVVHDVAALRRAIASIATSFVTARAGFVQIAGSLHDGHLALLARSRAENDISVVSVFVPPRAGDGDADGEDNVAADPDGRSHDLAPLADAGVDIVFAPTIEVMLPHGYATWIAVHGAADMLEGTSQAAHLREAATLTTRLLRMVQPHRAYVGEKDWQLVQVLRRIADDLLLEVEIVNVPTVRDADGLAHSSRNALLVPAARAAALTLSAALDQVLALFAAGVRDVAVLESRLRTRLLDEPALDVEYAVVVDAATLEPVTQLYAPARALVAVHVGGVRLIDNVALA